MDLGSESRIQIQRLLMMRCGVMISSVAGGLDSLAAWRAMQR